MWCTFYFSDSKKQAAKKKVIKKTGDDYANFYPVDEDSLYSKVLINHDNIPRIAYQYIQLYKRNTISTLEKLMKFFINVSGYKQFDIVQFKIEWSYDEAVIAALLKNPTKTLVVS